MQEIKMQDRFKQAEVLVFRFWWTIEYLVASLCPFRLRLMWFNLV